MLHFIPFEDDWDALERMRPEDLIPYRVGLLPASGLAAQVADTAAPSSSQPRRPAASCWPRDPASG